MRHRPVKKASSYGMGITDPSANLAIEVEGASTRRRSRSASSSSFPPPAPNPAAGAVAGADAIAAGARGTGQAGGGGRSRNPRTAGAPARGECRTTAGKKRREEGAALCVGLSGRRRRQFAVECVGDKEGGRSQATINLDKISPIPEGFGAICSDVVHAEMKWKGNASPPSSLLVTHPPPFMVSFGANSVRLLRPFLSQAFLDPTSNPPRVSRGIRRPCVRDRGACVTSRSRHSLAPQPPTNLPNPSFLFIATALLLRGGWLTTSVPSCR
nr:unnamed protein product [Digitaria exilis]